jgi:hypothetical protein
MTKQNSDNVDEVCSYVFLAPHSLPYIVVNWPLKYQDFDIFWQQFQILAEFKQFNLSC